MKPFSIHLTPPSDFQAAVEVAGCFISCRDQILYLHRHPEKPQGNTWGIPAGKLETGENPRDAVFREIKEETGLKLDPSRLKELGCLYGRLGKLDYIFHVFCTHYDALPELRLAKEEHLEAAWVTAADARKLPLIVGGSYALDFYLQKR